MSTLNFPSSPTIGEIYSFSGKQWEWNGSGWALVPVTAGVTSLNSLTGDILLEGGEGIAVAVRSGNVIGFDNLGLLDLNGLFGAVTLQAGLGMTITAQSGNVLLFEASVAGAVTSLNSMNGAVTLQAGSNVTITPLTGNVIQISSSGSGGGVASLNGLTDALTLQGGGGTSVTIESGGVLRITSSSGGGVDSLNMMVGDVTLQAGANTTITPQSGNVIVIESAGGGGPTYEEVILADNPWRYYRMDDTITTGDLILDYSGNVVNGTLLGNPTVRQPSLLYSGEGKSILFDGTGDAIDYNGAMKDLTSGGFLVEAVVNITSTSICGAIATVRFAQKSFSVGIGNTTMENNGNNLLGLQENVAWHTAATSIGTGTFHVALGFQYSGTITIFLNGIPVYFASTGSGAAVNTNNCVFNDSSTRGLECTMQEGALFWLPFLSNGGSGVVASAAMAAMVRRHYQAFKRGI